MENPADSQSQKSYTNTLPAIKTNHSVKRQKEE